MTLGEIDNLHIMCIACVYSVFQNFYVFLNNIQTLYFSKEHTVCLKKTYNRKTRVNPYHVRLHSMVSLCGYSVFTLFF